MASIKKYENIQKKQSIENAKFSMDYFFGKVRNVKIYRKFKLI